MTSARDIFVALACGRSGCPCATARAAGQTHCPAHDDEHPSLSISEHNGKALVRCHAGCEQDTVVAALRERSLWEGARSEVARRELTAYSYVGENGAPLYEVVRYEPKDFRQRRPDGRGGWIWNLEGVGRVVYNLPAVVAVVEAARREPDDPAWTVFITEGEKDADALNALGLVATTNTGGAGKWRDQYAEVLRGGRAVIIADKDRDEDEKHPKGRAHADAVASSLAGKVTSLKRIEMPGDHVKDASDWLAAGGTRDALLALVAAAPEMPVQPDAAPAPVPEDPGEPEDGPALLDALGGYIRRFVVVTGEAADAMSLWTLHTHSFAAADATPYLSIQSAVMRSGKTRILELLDHVVARPWMTGRTTAAALARKVDAVRPTLLLDEGDAAFNGDREYAEVLRGVLNSGHRRDGRVTVCVPQGANISFRDFSTFCPKAIAGIGKLPSTVADRSIPIVMQRRMRAEAIGRLRIKKIKPETDDLRQRAARWAKAEHRGARQGRTRSPRGT